MKKKTLSLISILVSAMLISCNSKSSSQLSSSTIYSSSDISISNSSINSSSSSSSSSGSSFVSSLSTDGNDWNVNTSLFGSAFRDSLAALMKSKRQRTCPYNGGDNNCLTVGAKAAAYPEGSNTFVPFYHTTDTLAKTIDCNREHTWPNSRGTGDKGFNDPFIIRPTLTSENSGRQNFFYGTGGSIHSEWDPASVKNGFEASRGECARVIFYTATMYASEGLKLSNNPSDKKTMGTLSTLVEWNNQYPPTEMEKQINEYYYANGYGRNPFVDHPEFANYIWNKEGLLSEPYNVNNSVTYECSTIVFNSVNIDRNYHILADTKLPESDDNFYRDSEVNSKLDCCILSSYKKAQYFSKQLCS